MTRLFLCRSILNPLTFILSIVLSVAACAKGPISEGPNVPSEHSRVTLPPVVPLSSSELSTDREIATSQLRQSEKVLGEAKSRFGNRNTNDLMNGNIPSKRYKGKLYRDGSWEVHSGNVASDHRYSRVGKGGVYTSTNPKAVHAELDHYGRPTNQRNIMDRDVDLDGLLDLTDPSVRKRLGLTLEDIAGDDYKTTQLLGDLARRGYKGIMAPSARSSDGVNIIVFEGFK